MQQIRLSWFMFIPVWHLLSWKDLSESGYPPIRTHSFTLYILCLRCARSEPSILSHLSYVLPVYYLIGSRRR